MPVEDPIAIDDASFMQEALMLAGQAAQMGEVPVGALVVCDGVVVGRAFNRREVDSDPLAHAEMAALAQAAEHLQRWRLSGCTLYCTLEPCFMCAGALVNARVDRLVYGALDPKAGAVASLASVCTDDRLNHRLDVQGGVLANESSVLLKGFFADLRNKRANAKTQEGQDEAET